MHGTGQSAEQRSLQVITPCMTTEFAQQHVAASKSLSAAGAHPHTSDMREVGVCA